MRLYGTCTQCGGPRIKAKPGQRDRRCGPCEIADVFTPPRRHWADVEADRIVNDWSRSVFSTGATADGALRAEIALALRRARARGHR